MWMGHNIPCNSSIRTAVVSVAAAGYFPSHNRRYSGIDKRMYGPAGCLKARLTVYNKFRLSWTWRNMCRHANNIGYKSRRIKLVFPGKNPANMHQSDICMGQSVFHLFSARSCFSPMVVLLHICLTLHLSISAEKEKSCSNSVIYDV